MFTNVLNSVCFNSLPFSDLLATLQEKYRTLTDLLLHAPDSTNGTNTDAHMSLAACFLDMWSMVRQALFADENAIISDTICEMARCVSAEHSADFHLQHAELLYGG